MAQVPTGPYSRALVDSIKRAEVMQAEAVLMIKEGYGVQDEKMVELDNLTWEKFNEILDRADRTGKREELENELRQMLASALTQILSQPPQTGQ